MSTSSERRVVARWYSAMFMPLYRSPAPSTTPSRALYEMSSVVRIPFFPSQATKSAVFSMSGFHLLRLGIKPSSSSTSSSICLPAARAALISVLMSSTPDMTCFSLNAVNSALLSFVVAKYLASGLTRRPPALYESTSSYWIERTFLGRVTYSRPPSSSRSSFQIAMPSVRSWL